MKHICAPALQQPIKGLTSGSMKWSANKDDDGKKLPYTEVVGKSACHYLKWRELSLHTALEKIQKLPNIAIKKWQIGLPTKKANFRKICWIISKWKKIHPFGCSRPLFSPLVGSFNWCHPSRGVRRLNKPENELFHTELKICCTCNV